MSQQGGVYPPREVKVPDFAKPASPSRYKYAKKVEDTKSAAEKSIENLEVNHKAERPDPSSPDTQAQDDGKSDSQQWEVVNAPKKQEKQEEKESCKHESGFSSSFSSQVGWGKWKFTPLSWDVSVKNQIAHDPGREGHEQDRNSTDQESKESK